MHLTCPSCGATFLVEPEHLGPTGRRVRCGECGHTWHQARPSEAEAAEQSEAKAAAAPFAPAEPVAEPAAEPAAAEASADRAAAEPVAEQAPAEPAAEPTTAEASADRAAAEPIPELAPEPADAGERGPRRAVSRPPRPRRQSSLAAGWLLFCVVVVGLGAGFYFGRAQLVAMVPQMTRLYDLVGLPAQPGGAGLDTRERKEPVGAGLDIRDPKYVQRLAAGKPVVVIEGLVANVSGQTRKVPLLLAILTDADGVEVARWTFSASATALPPGETTGFETIPEVPPGGGSIKIVFAPEN